jgi:hypothetical protein
MFQLWREPSDIQTEFGLRPLRTTYADLVRLQGKVAKISNRIPTFLGFLRPLGGCRLILVDFEPLRNAEQSQSP